MRAITLGLTLTLLSGCTFNTDAGKCVGWINKDEKRPELTYEVSGWNIAWAVVLADTVVAPILLTGYALECPK
jgi:hypothetical protein